ncbi:MAG: hypothetical protein ACI4MO_03185 [Christensenellales bacterium]
MRGYFDSHNGKISLELTFLRVFLLKAVLFECKGKLYYQIGKRDFKRIMLSNLNKSIDETKPTSREKTNFTRLLPIPLDSLHVNLSYCATDVWSATFRPLLESFVGVIEYFYRRFIRCGDTSIVINDAIARQGFMLSVRASIKVLTILKIVTQMLFIEIKSPKKSQSIKTKTTID